jgi:hypothetical protein
MSTAVYMTVTVKGIWDKAEGKLPSWRDRGIFMVFQNNLHVYQTYQIFYSKEMKHFMPFMATQMDPRINNATKHRLAKLNLQGELLLLPTILIVNFVF